MSAVLSKYRTLDEDEAEAAEGIEAETALDSEGKVTNDVAVASHGKQRSDTSGHAPYTEPKISGKAWGRVFKFFKGIKEYPKSLPYIIGNEFCERFTYYGLRVVLILYLTDHIGYDDNRATALFHTFVMLCYASPLFGAMLADGWLGKYRTILYLSIVYATGNLVLAGTSAPLGTETATRVVPMVGLLLIAFGTGGIKPCVSAHGGDQFTESQTHLLPRYFAAFYFSINAGSLFSTYLSPYLRANTQCFGSDCYLYAFGLPAILMIIAIIIFVAGKKYYVKIPLTGNVILQFVKAVGRAIKNRILNRSSTEKKDHWLYWAEDKYERHFLDDIRKALGVIFILSPVPIFWTLYDQSGSRWILQAKRMDGRLGTTTIEPDQLGISNAIMILLFIPLFESVIYPALRFCRLPMRPLQRMSAGMLCGGLAFVIAAFVQIRLEDATNAVPPHGTAELRVINGLPAGLHLDVTQSNGIAAFGRNLRYGETTGLWDFPPGLFTVSINTTLKGQSVTLTQDFNVTDQSVTSIVAGYSNNQVSLFQADHDVSKLGGKQYAVRVLNCNPELGRIWSSLYWYDKSAHKNHSYDFGYKVSDNSTGYTPFSQSAREIPSPPAGNWLLEVYDFATNQSRFNATYEFSNGAMYTIVLLPSNSSTPGSVYAVKLVDVSPASLHILWQIPQYTVLTVGEIMFSITGLEFAYSQSPQSMKSVMQAVWLLTVAIGNLIVVIVAESEIFHNQVHEFFFFAAMIVAVTGVFIVLAIRYTYVNLQDEPGVGKNGDASNSERYETLNQHSTTDEES